MGPGMMGGYGPGYGMGPGMMGGYGPGYGMGPGMMGGYGPGYGMGPGMMSGMMGPGMMGGYGMGPGMMGGYEAGYGMGPGMMGGALVARLNDAQRSQVNKIQDEVRRKNWDVLGKKQDEMAKLRDAYASGKPDRAAILGAYKRIGELRLQRIENTLDASEKLEGVLTKGQREQIRHSGPLGMMGIER